MAFLYKPSQLYTSRYINSNKQQYMYAIKDACKITWDVLYLAWLFYSEFRYTLISCTFLIENGSYIEYTLGFCVNKVITLRGGNAFGIDNKILYPMCGGVKGGRDPVEFFSPYFYQ